MVSNQQSRENRARRGFRGTSGRALLFAVVASACSGKTLVVPEHVRDSATGGDSSGGASAGSGSSLTGGAPSTGGSSGAPGAGGFTPGSGGTTGTGGRDVSAGGEHRGAGGTPASSGGAKGAGGTTDASAGAGGATSPPILEPIVPAVTGDCPTFQDGAITFMGLNGIKLAVGTRTAEGTAPMLFYWHGTASTSDEYVNMAAPVVTGIIQAGGVIVSFQGSTGGDINSGTNVFGKGDLLLTDQLVACAVRDAGIDPRRIYTMGCSAGGLFATAMAALRSSYIAAVSPNSGGEVLPIPFQNSHTPPLMAIHGAPEETLVIDFTQTSITAEKAFKAVGGLAIDCDTHGATCGGTPLAGDVWKFFQAHPFGADPEPWTAGLPAGFSSECLIE